SPDGRRPPAAGGDGRVLHEVVPAPPRSSPSQFDHLLAAAEATPVGSSVPNLGSEDGHLDLPPDSVGEQLAETAVCVLLACSVHHHLWKKAVQRRQAHALPGTDDGEYPFENGVSGSVRVTTGDVNHDGRADIVVVPGASALTTVNVFSGDGLPLVK